MTISFLLAVGDKRDRIGQGRASEAEWVSAFERVRSNGVSVGPAQQRVVAFATMFSRTGVHAPALAAAFEEFGLTFDAFCTRLRSAEDIANLASDAPNLDVFVTLTVNRNQDMIRRIQANDLRDLDWLSVALPYSNCIVMENYWCHQARATHLDTKYGTALLTDLRQLPDELKRLGCMG
jgi:hypothetical protein